MIKCNCNICGIDIFRNKHHFSRNKTKRFFCSKECLKERDNEKISCTCTLCHNVFQRNPKRLNESGNNFCSQSCAAKFNNQYKKKPDKEKLESRRKNKCKTCDAKIYYRSIFCKSCNKQSTNYVLNKTLGEHSYNKGSERYAKIRDNARVIYKKSGKSSSCKACGYHRHVEICHIRPIKQFSPESLISEINDLSNLVALCRNCHWEMDHNFISIKSIKENTNPFPFCF